MQHDLPTQIMSAKHSTVSKPQWFQSPKLNNVTLSLLTQ